MANPSSKSITPDPLRQKRETIRRGVLRANTVLGIIWVAVMCLALAALWEALQGEQNERRATQAERTQRQELWQTYLAEAKAARLGGLVGQRREALRATANAAAIMPTVAVRNEALASLALDDMQEEWRIALKNEAALLVEFSPGLKYFATGGLRSDVVVRRLADGSEVVRLERRLLRRPALRPMKLAFDRNARYFAVLFELGPVVVLDLEQGQIILRHEPSQRGATGDLEFTDDGAGVAFADPDRGGAVVVASLPTGKIVEEAPGIEARRFSFRPGSPGIAVASDRTIGVRESIGGTNRWSFSFPEAVQALTWAPDGRRLAVATADWRVWLCDLEANAAVPLGVHPNRTVGLAFSPAGDLLLSSSASGTTLLWDVERAQLLLTVTGGRGRAFNQGGNRIAFERLPGEVGVWRLALPDGYRSLPCVGGPTQALLVWDLDREGRWLAALAPGGLEVWNLPAGGPGRFFPLSDLRSLVMHPQGQGIVLTRSHGVEFRRLELDPTGQIHLGAAQVIALPGGLDPRNTALSADAGALAAEGMDFSLMTLSLSGARPPVVLQGRQAFRNYLGPASAAGAGRFGVSPDGRFLVMGYDMGDGPTVWVTATGQLLRELDSAGGPIAFDPRGASLVVCGPNRYDFWDPVEWKRTRRIEAPGLLGRQGSAAFFAGEQMVALVQDENSVQLVETRKGTEIARLTAGDPKSIRALRVSADGRRLVASTFSNSLLVWDLAVMRKELQAMGLNWGDENPGARLAGPPAPPRWSGFLGVILVSVVGMLVAGAGVLVVMHRHRQLVRDFATTEVLVEQRGRELEMAKIELMHSQKMRALGTLAAGIAHDFNNLLSVIRMSNKLIKREPASPVKVAEYNASIEHAVMQGKRLVDSMLGYSRLPTGGSNTLFHVPGLVRDSVGLFRKEFLSGVEVELELDETVPRVSIPPGRLEQLLVNLLVNSAEALNSHGRLWLSVRVVADSAHPRLVLPPRPAQRYLALSVKDTGPGIAPEMQTRIFEPFFTTKKHGGQRGTGMGLYMVYTIAEQDGLGIALDSMVGVGTEFCIFVPVDARSEKESGPAPAPA